ncbi:FAD-dependent tricarballylate dehydrogenase TcuA [Streptomyces werraensis]|uniref:FAD-dependent tricarballylate dehydrogenase TcuA n=1 Tax=Streptomyces werraensis TaxID=68284 RepID=UPI003812D43A
MVDKDRIDNKDNPDVIVVGTGNAAFCAAHAATERGARVLMLDKAPAEASGGNTFFTAGAIRTTYGGVEELAELIDDGDTRLPHADIAPYGPDDFIADMRRVTQGHCDPELTRTMAQDIAGTIRWMRAHGIRFRLQYERQSHEVQGRHRFFGNLPLATVDGGKGLVAQHHSAAERSGVAIRYSTEVDRLLIGPDGRVTGVASGTTEFRAPSVVLASGGFQANSLLRAQYLGPNWDLAKVRGTPYNTGQALQAALDLGAAPAGHWSGCHAVAWDADAPQTGDFELTNRYTKQSYPYSIVVNADGHRFLDEGADLRNYTYAKYGAEILRQPGARAWQIFDARTTPLLGKAEYEAPGVSRIQADSIAELAERAGIDPAGLEHTVKEYNAATSTGTFDPSRKDGLGTTGLQPPKSNWAQPLDQPPYLAFAVTCGITFTFGGLKIDTDARVLDTEGAAIPGLFAAGETVGGLFAHNYPGGSGLSAGAVFGRRAGTGAAALALDTRAAGQ